MTHPLHRPRGANPAAVATATRQHGVALLEIVCALLIFAVGVLGLVKLQAVSVQQASDARYRALAALQVSDLIGKMWVSDRTPATLKASFSSDGANGAGYASWLAAVWASGLPGVAGRPPTVSIATVSGLGTNSTDSSLATITVYWKAPGDADYHKHVALAQVK
jgi:type IV pilus assembly protein PilV